MTTTLDPKKSYIGTCQACFRAQVVKGAGHVMVLHGYERPGHGYIEGRCPGIGHQPYELSCELTKQFKANLEAALPHLEASRLDFINDRVESYTRTIVDYDAAHNIWSHVERPLKLVVLKRGESYRDSHGYRFTFEDLRLSTIAKTAQKIEAMKENIKFLGERIESWVYAPEALKTHEALAAEVKLAREEKAAQARFRKDWKRLWKTVADAVYAHKNGYAWQARSKAVTEDDAKAFMLANPFPSDKDRAAARKRAK